MFDYAQRLKLALTDTARRSAFKAAAGVVFAIAAGFLLAALWSALDSGLGWGPIYASLAIGAGFVAIGAILLLVAARPRHAMPTTDELKREVEARVNLAADAAVDRARTEAARMADMAGNKVHSLLDQASFRANKLASDTERRVQGLARDTARKAGLTGENVEAARQAAGRASQKAGAAANSNAGSMAKLLAAFAVGVTLAARLRDRPREDPVDFDEDDLL
ncbi:phage holin family protein [Paracoccus siganidrum]|uniref:Phage holin family protein n=1 Tax=Paracoccus siganidrum TaxID=1276757 RepID=A0A419A9H2_9RHOB|nr:phage holin family protein [Paracoccus siganidrum]RJL19082.1 phage holin family protein [Paracoccus siganidrum]RMC40382.1 phage holin family protein [Paracoccus siganidrum]